jgi:hypothetical protein
MPEATEKASYKSPMGGKNRHVSATGDDLAPAEDLIQKKLALMVGTIKRVSESVKLDITDFPMSGTTAQFQDAVFVFKKDDETITVQVPDVSKDFKATSPAGTNKLITTGAVANFVTAWIAAEASHTGYALDDAYFTTH